MKSLLGILTLLLAACAPAAAEPPSGPRPAQSAVAAWIDEHAAAHHFSGTILVRAEGRPVYARSFGLADRAFQVPATDDTRYLAASITKLFTSALVLQLVEEGRLALHVPIRTYLPDYPGEGADRLTLHHLLNHTSGLAQYDRIASLDQALQEGIEAYQRPQSAAQLLRRCCSGPLVREPGAAFDYNNADYILLARIAERVTGKSYETLLGERILRPLSLDDTGIAHQHAIIARLAPTYYWREDRQMLMNDLPFYFENWDAAGALYSTAADVADFAEALFGGRLLEALSLALMLNPGLDDYGYGLWSYSFEQGGRRHRVAKRPGSIMGANSVLYRLLDDGITIVILANTNRTDLDEFAQRMAERLLAGDGP